MRLACREEGVGKSACFSVRLGFNEAECAFVKELSGAYESFADGACEHDEDDFLVFVCFICVLNEGFVEGEVLYF